MESKAATTKMSRRRRKPLHTCGVLLSTLACKAYTKAQDIKGPIGSMTKKIITMATPTIPFVHALQYQWLAVLSFADDHILVIEHIIETLFPPSTRLFDKIDKLVHSAEALPAKFDNAVIKFPSIIHQIPFLDWGLVFLISWLNFFISKLTHCGSNSAKEKEIKVDMNYNDINKESKKPSIFAASQDEPTMVTQSENVGRLSPISDFENESMTGHTTDKSDGMKCSYKEILEKGKKGNAEKKEDGSEEANPTANTSETGDVENSKNDENENTGKEDPILQLFEASWHMKLGKGSKPMMQRSLSYT
ncbi:unnamed protein product [Camellia sinensis]